jgi:hypothetical protein
LRPPFAELCIAPRAAWVNTDHRHTDHRLIIRGYGLFAINGKQNIQAELDFSGALTGEAREADIVLGDEWTETGWYPGSSPWPCAPSMIQPVAKRARLRALRCNLEWMKGVGRPPIIVRSTGSKLGHDLVNGGNSTGQRFASIPAFTAVVDGGENIGKTRRQCTKEYKIEVIERYLRYELLGMRPYQKMPKDVRIHQTYGISLDEAGRSVRIRERLEGRPWIAPVFPLLERQMTRGYCYQWLQKFRPGRLGAAKLLQLALELRDRFRDGCCTFTIHGSRPRRLHELSRPA